MAEKVYVEALVLGFSPSAADSSKTSLNVVNRLPMVFDFGPHPSAWHDRNRPPTAFATETEAKEKVDDLIVRCKGIARVGQKLNRPVDIGRAAMLFGRDFDGKRYGGYETAPYAVWEAERNEEERVDSVVAEEQLAQADLAVQQAQERADGLRGEIKPLAARQTASTSKWVATGVPKVQVYRRTDGTESFRGRDTEDGRTITSPAFDTIEEATAWVEGDREPDKPSDGRAEAIEAMRDRVVRT